jgi:hydroxymethylpyrimidine pyrophosphatase-like HAD family hydrolase
MIERFHGIAMGNAIPSVKKAAEIVTKDVSEHGVSYCLEEILRVI